jgi:hypothetical protein
MAVCRFPVVFRVALVGILSPVAARPQANISADEIPIERCDVLPVVELRIDSTDMRFLRVYWCNRCSEHQDVFLGPLQADSNHVVERNRCHPRARSFLAGAGTWQPSSEQCEVTRH